MICPDCHPTVKGVELCPRHEEMEERHDAVVALIAESHERRRLALLQAAATMLEKIGSSCSKDDPAYDPQLYAYCVDDAQALLSEIEKREPPEATK